jgi:serine/threonine-protein kinase RsbW
MTRGSSVRLDFPSSLDLLDLVHSVSDHMGKVARLDEDALHWLNVAVRECVINAIRHGNGNDASKQVHLEFTPFEEQLADCCAPENLLKSSGRGIFLIRSFMDQMDLRRAPEGGMEVVMVKRAQPQQA